MRFRVCLLSDTCVLQKFPNNKKLVSLISAESDQLAQCNHCVSTMSIQGCSKWFCAWERHFCLQIVPAGSKTSTTGIVSYLPAKKLCMDRNTANFKTLQSCQSVRNFSRWSESWPNALFGLKKFRNYHSRIKNLRGAKKYKFSEMFYLAELTAHTNYVNL